MMNIYSILLYPQILTILFRAFIILLIIIFSHQGPSGSKWQEKVHSSIVLNNIIHKPKLNHYYTQSA